MKISKKTDYALRALFYLVEHRESGPISIGELARQNAVPKRFLEHIMLDLKSQGWVRSVAGKNGGYALAKNPGSISMGEVVRYFDGLLAPINCVSAKQYKACSQEKRCRFRQVFLEIRDNTARTMEMATLESVVNASPERSR